MNKRQKKKKYKEYVEYMLKIKYNSFVKKGGKVFTDSSGSIRIKE